MFKHDGVRVPRPTTPKPKTTRYLRPHRTNLLRALDKSLRLFDAGYTIGIKCEWTYIYGLAFVRCCCGNEQLEVAADIQPSPHVNLYIVQDAKQIHWKIWPGPCDQGRPWVIFDFLLLFVLLTARRWISWLGRTYHTGPEPVWTAGRKGRSCQATRSCCSKCWWVDTFLRSMPSPGSTRDHPQAAL